jgi:hypothetical protein
MSIIAAYTKVADLRGDKTLDQVLAPPTLFSIWNVFSAEMEASGAFEKVLAVPSDPLPSSGELRARNVQVLLEPFLFRLDSVVPDHESPQKEAFLVTLFGGSIAALIWASMPVDVYGYATLMVRTTDLTTGKQTGKMYEGKTRQRSSLGECDEPETRSRVVGLALKDLMTAFRADLRSRTPEGESDAADTPQ